MRMSYDEGETWPVRKVIDPGISGYSDMAVTPDGRIHLLYEGGSVKEFEGNHFKNDAMSVLSFNLEWLTDGEDKLSPNDAPLNRLQP